MKILDLILWPVSLAQKSFWETVIGAGAKVLGGSAASIGLDSIFGESEGSQERADRKSFAQQQQLLEQGHRHTKREVKLGNRLDMRNQRRMFDYRIDQGLEHGMTPYEMFMGPAAGAGGGTTGTGATLGNAAAASSRAQAEISAQQAADRRSFQQQSAENQKDRMASIAQTAMQTEAQKDVAGIQAGTQQRGQDLQKEIADNVLSLNQRELNEVKIPQAAAQLNLTRQQLQTEINKTATSSERFQTAMKQLSMGPANLLVELTMRNKGISLSDDSFMKLSEQERAEILTELTAMASTLYIEAKGFEGVTENVKRKAKGIEGTLADWIASLILGSDSPGIEPTGAPPNPAKLGSRMSEAYQAGPNMNYR